MRNPEWGVGTFVWYGNTSVAQWPSNSETFVVTHPLQVQGIPGEFANQYPSGLFSPSGVWYISSGNNDNPPGVLFFAPYDTGIFTEVVRLSDRNGLSFDVLIHPDGLVAMQGGTRWLYVLSPSGGILHEQELPASPGGDGAGNDLIRLMSVFTSPDSRIGVAYGSVAVLDSGILDDGWETSEVIGVVFSDLFYPGDPVDILPGFYIVPTSGTISIDSGATRLTALAPSIYTQTDILGRAAGRNTGVYPRAVFKGDAAGTTLAYHLTLPSEANGIVPIQLVTDRIELASRGPVIWPDTGVTGEGWGIEHISRVTTLPAPSGIIDQLGESFYYEGALVWAPLPTTPPFWTSFVRTIEVVERGVAPGPDPDGPYADFLLVAGYWEDSAAPGSPNVGYSAFTAGGTTGELTPNPVSISGIVFPVMVCAHTGVLAGQPASLAITVDDVWGAAEGTLTISELDYVIPLIEDEWGMYGNIPLPESPFVAGQTYNIRLYLEGDLRSEP